MQDLEEGIQQVETALCKQSTKQARIGSERQVSGKLETTSKDGKQSRVDEKQEKQKNRNMKVLPKHLGLFQKEGFAASGAKYEGTGKSVQDIFPAKDLEHNFIEAPKKGQRSWTPTVNKQKKTNKNPEPGIKFNSPHEIYWALCFMVSVFEELAVHCTRNGDDSGKDIFSVTTNCYTKHRKD